MRAPQYGKVRPPMPVGHGSALAKGLRVEPFANVFALVEGLGVISLHQTVKEAEAALQARRREAK